jgi:hypothetical protein
MDQSISPKSPVRILMGALFSDMEPLFEAIARFSRPEVAAAFSAAIREAFEDFERRTREEEKAFVDFVVQNGWVGLERYFTSELLHLLVQIGAEQGIEAANARMPDIFSIERLETMVGGWRGIPYLEDRSQLCSEAIQAHRLGLHTLVPPALIPLAEGLAAEIVGGRPNATDKVRRAARAQQHHPSSDKEFGVATVAVLEDYYQHTNFGKAAAPALFNRHLILHGRSADYHTPCNSLRAFLLVDTVADIWYRLKKQATPRVATGSNQSKN